MKSLAIAVGSLLPLAVECAQIEQPGPGIFDLELGVKNSSIVSSQVASQLTDLGAQSAKGIRLYDLHNIQIYAPLFVGSQ